MELLNSIEQSALLYSTGAMILTGAGAVLFGLMVWLGGLRWSKIISILTGAAIGAVCGLFFSTREPIAIALFALIMGLMALFFEKVSMVLICAMLTAAVALAVFVVQSDTSQWPPLETHSSESLSSVQTAQVSLEQVRILAEQFRSNISKCNIYGYLAAAIAGLIVSGLGIVFTRFISALGASLAGVILIFTGMTILLLNKGSRPLTMCANNMNFFLMAFVIMLSFGVIIQMFLCPKKKRLNKKGRNGDKNGNL